MRRAALALALAAALIAPASAAAHPLGNFTVNQYARLDVAPDAVRVLLLLDMAEIAALRERPRIDADGDGTVSAPERRRYAAAAAARLAQGLGLTIGGRPAALRAESAVLTLPPGQAGLSTLRLRVLYTSAAPGLGDRAVPIALALRNYPERIGWREVVATAAPGADLARASVPAIDRTRELTAYPQGLLQDPLDVRSASLEATPGDGTPGAAPLQSVDSAPPARRRRSLRRPAGERHGARGVLLALAPGPALRLAARPHARPRQVHRRGLPGRLARHARHALYLGATVTVSHVASVLTLGLVTLTLSEWILPEQLYPWLTLASGLMVVGIGLRRCGRARAHAARAARRAAEPAAGCAAAGMAMRTPTSTATPTGAVTSTAAQAHGHSHAPPDDLSLRALIGVGVPAASCPARPHWSCCWRPRAAQDRVRAGSDRRVLARHRGRDQRHRPARAVRARHRVAGAAGRAPDRDAPGRLRRRRHLRRGGHRPARDSGRLLAFSGAPCAPIWEPWLVARSSASSWPCSICTVGVALALSRQIQRQEAAERSGAATAARTQVETKVSGIASNLASLARLSGRNEFEFGLAIEPWAFQALSSSLLRQSGVQGVFWMPAVLGRLRGLTETTYGVPIVTAGHDPAPERGLYLPIVRAAPAANYLSALGRDLWADPSLRAAMVRARDSAEYAVADPVAIVPGDPTSIIFQAVYATRTVPQGEIGRSEDLSGYVAVVLSPEGLVGDIERSVPGVGAVQLADVGGGLLYTSPSPMGEPVEERINLPGEDWTLRVGLHGGGTIRHVAPLVTLVGGLLLAILVGLLGRHLANRRSYAEALVRERTAELEEVAAKLGDAKASYERLTANIAEVLFTVELDDEDRARTLFDGGGMERLLGGRLPEGADAAEFWRGRVHPDDREQLQDAFTRASAEGRAEAEVRVAGLDGVTRWIRTSYQAEREAAGRRLVHGVASDVTEQRRGAEATRRLSLLARYSSDIVVAIARDLTVLSINKNGAARLGWEPTEIVGHSWERFVSPEHRESTRVQIAADFENRTGAHAETLCLTREAQPCWVSWNGVFDAQSDQMYYIGRDVTVQVDARAEAERRSRTDPLTDLPNRRHLLDEASAELSRAGRSGQHPAILMADIDHFKASTTATATAARRGADRVAGGCAARCAEYDAVARWGGEEFCALRAAARRPGGRASAVRREAARDRRRRAGALPDGSLLGSRISVGVAAPRRARPSRGWSTTPTARSTPPSGAAATASRRLRHDAETCSPTSPRRTAWPRRSRSPPACARACPRRTLAGRRALHGDRAAPRPDGARSSRCRLGGWLHDVGKVAIPDSILAKRGPLDEGEWAIMRAHPIIGEELIAPRPGLRRGRARRAAPPRALGRRRVPGRPRRRARSRSRRASWPPPTPTARSRRRALPQGLAARGGDGRAAPQRRHPSRPGRGRRALRPARRAGGRGCATASSTAPPLRRSSEPRRRDAPRCGPRARGPLT